MSSDGFVLGFGLVGAIGKDEQNLEDKRHTHRDTHTHCLMDA